jgi:hypothetical protein
MDGHHFDEFDSFKIKFPNDFGKKPETNSVISIHQQVRKKTKE